MLDERFKLAIGLELNDWESDLTRDVIQAIQQWGVSAASVIGVQDLAAPQIGGIPIGLAAVRIITNVLLYEMDRAIVDALHPIYYGRYVDDVFPRYQRLRAHQERRAIVAIYFQLLAEHVQGWWKRG